MAIDYSNPFLQSLGNVRTQPQQNQFMQPQQDFSGWGDRLNKIEKGIAGLTEQFSNFQAPGDVEPEYTGNAAPEPLEQSANIPEPLGGIESLVAEPAPAAPTTAMGGQGQSPFGMGGGQGLSQQSRWTSTATGPMTEEQFASQKDLWGRRQDYSKFAGMAGDVTGTAGRGGIRSLIGGDPRFGHAYEAWQDYAAGYGGSDPSQGMENWMQDYNFDLAPERPQFNFQYGQQIQPGQGFQSIMADYHQAQLDYTNSPEYQAWQQREEGRGPLSASTIKTMGGGLRPMGGPPDINPFAMASETYEDYLSNIENMKRMRETQIAQYPTTSPNVGQPVRGITAAIQGFQNTIPGAGTAALAASAPALQGPVQQQIQQGLGSLSQGAGV